MDRRDSTLEKYKKNKFSGRREKIIHIACCCGLQPAEPGLSVVASSAGISPGESGGRKKFGEIFP
jgi:hypothetical protein